MSDINIGLLAENQNLSEFEITEKFWFSASKPILISDISKTCFSNSD